MLCWLRKAVGLGLFLEDWYEYLRNLEEDELKLEACLGGVEISQASSRGVFDFNLEEIMTRYTPFLQGNKPPQDDDICGNQDDTATSPNEANAPDRATGDSLSDPKEKVPDTDENGDGLGKKASTLDQWLNQIITHPEAPSLNEVEEEEDKSFNSANFWKEEQPKLDMVDHIIQEMGL